MCQAVNEGVSISVLGRSSWPSSRVRSLAIKGLGAGNASPLKAWPLSLGVCSRQAVSNQGVTFSLSISGAE
eukprot:10029-Eustigmatos_ZCMA.PRE.1